MISVIRRNNFIMDSSEEESDGRRRKSQWKKFGTPVRATSRKKEQIRYELGYPRVHTHAYMYTCLHIQSCMLVCYHGY